MTTLLDVFEHRTTGEHARRVYLQYKPDRAQPFASITFAEFRERVLSVAAAFRELGIVHGDRVAIISESRPEWLITDFALITLGAISVPMYPTLTQKQVEHLLVDSGAVAAVVSNDLQFGKVVKSIDRATALKRVVAMLSVTRTSEVLSERVQVVPWNALEQHALVQPAQYAMPSPDDVVTIVYTSGTTGEPRGVMLTHRNLLANVEGAMDAIPTVDEHDTFLSFLPLSHSFERIASYLVFYAGASIAFAQSIDTVSENMLEIRPTVMTGVPRFFERVHGRILKSRDAMPDARKKIFDWAMNVGKAYGRACEGVGVPLLAKLQYPLADKLVLGKIRERTGGRIRFFVSGAAVLNADVGRAFAGFGLPVIEGYGMTETSPVISVTPYKKIKWGKVGVPLKNVEVKIADDGEILARGASVMKGYFNMPEATNDAIDSEGWMHTGDIGTIDADGYIAITDRKKHLFVSSGGKNIAPAPIESMFEQSPLIEQILLIGDKRQYCAALIVPNMDEVRGRLDDTTLVLPATPTIESEAIRGLLSHEIDRLQKDSATYERIRRFTLMSQPFTIENGMLTPTFKIKRKVVELTFGEVIENMYRVL